jgi:hypothetical protein
MRPKADVVREIGHVRNVPTPDVGDNVRLRRKRSGRFMKMTTEPAKT